MTNKIKDTRHTSKKSPRIGSAEVLKYSKEYFQSLTENLSDVIIVLDHNLNIVYKSSSFERAVGESRSQESNPYNFVHPDDMAMAAEKFKELLQNPHHPIFIEIRGQHRDGSWRYFEAVAKNLLKDPVVQGIVVNFKDITERKRSEQELEQARMELETKVEERTRELKETVQALQLEISERKRIEDALKESEKEYSVLVSNLADAVFTFKNGKLTWGNDRIEEMLGFSKEEFIGADVDIFMPADDSLKKLYKNVSSGLNRSGHFHGITQVRKKDGAVVDIEYTASMVPGKDPVELVGIARDITERRIAIEAIQDSEKRYRLLAENVTDVIWTIDKNLRFTYVSPSVEYLLGYTADEALSLTVEQTISDETLEKSMSLFKQLLSSDQSECNKTGNTTLEIELTRNDGFAVWTETKVSILRDDDERPMGILGISRDITERRLANDAMEKTAKQILALQKIITSFQSTLELQQILQHVAEAVVTHMDFDHAIIILKEEDRDVNKARLFHTRGGSKLLKEVQELLNQTISTVEYPIYRGYTKFADDTLDKKVTVTNQLYEICKPVLSLDESNSTQQLLEANMIVSAPIFFKDKYVGNIMTFTENERVFDEDIDILKLVADHAGVAIENAKLNEELEERIAQRTKQLQTANKELENFAYSLAHDLRTPLRGIDGFSQVLLEDYSPVLDEQGRNYLGRVRAASQRMAHLIDDILHLLYITRSEMSNVKVQLSILAQEIADTMRHMEPQREVEFCIEPGLTVKGDPDLLREVLEHLFSNSWKFTKKQTNAVIEFGSMQKDGQTVYYVRDNGVGFDMSYVKKIFTAFQRLHLPTEYDGTGIGLATVQRIINRHGGEVWAEGEIDKGATFYFTL